MKTLFSLIFYVLFMSGSIMPQQANTYFPENTGITWNYVVTPLDSANNGIDPLTFYRADSFATVADYNGMLANIVFSKSGDINTLPAQSYNDSLFYHFEGSNAFEYSQVGNQEFLLRTMDSLQIDPNFSFLDFFTSLEDWYSIYKFEQPIESEYTILSIDTTLNNGVLTLPLRFEHLGMRLQNEVIETQIGNLDSKKFLIKNDVSLIITPTITIPLVSIEDTIWIATDKWILKSIIPSAYVDLSLLGVDPLFIAGVRTEITEIFLDVEVSTELPTDIYLDQNYPNPFNPSTNIRYSVPQTTNVVIKVFDILGKEIETLVNEEKPIGTYEIIWNADNLPSGIYFYRLQAGSFVETKKMVLMK